jgi:hypothetical protein
MTVRRYDPDHFNTVRTGRASAVLDRIRSTTTAPTPLKNIATISVPEPRLLTSAVHPTAMKRSSARQDPTSASALERRQDHPPAVPQLTGGRLVLVKHGRGGPVAVRNVAAT